MTDRKQGCPSITELPLPAVTVRLFKEVRQGMTLGHWPSEDRTRWLRAKTRNGLFDRDAILHSLKPPTVRGLEQSMGRFLQYVACSQKLLPDTSIRTILTPELVNEYVGFILNGLRAGSVHEELRRLRAGLGILLPDDDITWVNALPRKPSRASVLASRKPIARPNPAQVLAAAYRVFDAAPTSRRDTETSQTARNSLMVAMCVLFGLRLGDLTRIQLGKHLRQSGSRWRLHFSSDVKNGALLLFDIPRELAQRLETYLATWRRTLLGNRADHGFLWVARGGKPPREQTIAAGINKFGRIYLGRHLNSHVFRHVFAVTTVLRNVADADLTAVALGHTGERMVTGTYTSSDEQEISRLWLRKLANRRKKRLTD